MSKETEYEMFVTLRKDDLIEECDKELEEMEGWPDEIDIRLVLRSAMEWVQKLNHELFRKDISEVEKSALYIKELSFCWKGQVGTPCILEYDFDELQTLERMSPNTLQEIPILCADLVLKLIAEIE